MASHSESHATGSAGCTLATSLMAVLSSGASACFETYSSEVSAAPAAVAVAGGGATGGDGWMVASKKRCGCGLPGEAATRSSGCGSLRKKPDAESRVYNLKAGQAVDFYFKYVHGKSGGGPGGQSVNF